MGQSTLQIMGFIAPEALEQPHHSLDDSNDQPHAAGKERKHTDKSPAHTGRKGHHHSNKAKYDCNYGKQESPKGAGSKAKKGGNEGDNCGYADAGPSCCSMFSIHVRIYTL